MSSEILFNVRPTETRVAYIENGVVTDLKVERKTSPMVGAILRGKVNRVLPGMQAAFVDIGLDRAAFLYVGDVRRMRPTRSRWSSMKMLKKRHRLSGRRFRLTQ